MGADQAIADQMKELYELSFTNQMWKVNRKQLVVILNVTHLHLIPYSDQPVWHSCL